ncbi:hypothetical protein BN1708_018293, partial [Verticillium longisporum]
KDGALTRKPRPSRRLWRILHTRAPADWPHL